jgi:hypothetical protein
MRYGAPSGQHDDCVMALAIAWSAVSGQHRAIYPVAESELIVQPFEIPAHWPRAYGLDIGCRSTAAIWAALDHPSDVLYLYDEYVCLDGEPSADAEVIKSAEDGFPGPDDGERPTGWTATNGSRYRKLLARAFSETLSGLHPEVPSERNEHAAVDGVRCVDELLKSLLLPPTNEARLGRGATTCRTPHGPWW